jgi:hypothetical protein
MCPIICLKSSLQSRFWFPYRSLHSRVDAEKQSAELDEKHQRHCAALRSYLSLLLSCGHNSFNLMQIGAYTLK